KGAVWARQLLDKNNAANDAGVAVRRKPARPNASAPSNIRSEPNCHLQLCHGKSPATTTNRRRLSESSGAL
ncbi:MAG TPA: hypothetical protein VFQ87_18215, partial [Bradyrhizobium sp.]|nr:hypothetical protein [Bradyrhizobium sp.]